ncbi:hypothetical protein FXO37_25302 [Capsicum annuum]|nr:hypothetical protein FXO37_25302 [Capsicum annuum]
MDSLSSVSPAIVLPNGKLFRHHRRRISSFSSNANSKPYPRYRISIFNHNSSGSGSSRMRICCKLSSNNGDKEKEDEEVGRFDEVERALRMDGTIPGTPNEFVEQVSSRAYDMRRHLQQSFDSSSYDGELFISPL